MHGHTNLRRKVTVPFTKPSSLHCILRQEIDNF